MIQRISNCLLEKRAQVLALIARKYVQGIVYNSGDKKRQMKAGANPCTSIAAICLRSKTTRTTAQAMIMKAFGFFISDAIVPKAQAK